MKFTCILTFLCLFLGCSTSTNPISSCFCDKPEVCIATNSLNYSCVNIDCRQDFDEPLEVLGVEMTMSGPIRMSSSQCRNKSRTTNEPPAVGRNFGDALYGRGGDFTHERNDSPKLRAQRWRTHFLDVLLMIHFNWGNDTHTPTPDPPELALTGLHDSLQMHIDFYGDVFPNIIGIGPANNASGIYRNKWVACDSQGGIFMYYCVGIAMEQRSGFKGYLLINNDVVFNYWSIPLTDTWASHYWMTKTGRTIVIPALPQILSSFPQIEQNTLLLNDGEGPRTNGSVRHSLADFYYVPGRFASDFTRVSRGIYKFAAKLFRAEYMEALTNLIMRMTATADEIDILVTADVHENEGPHFKRLDMRGIDAWYLWGSGTRKEWPKAYRNGMRVVFIHAVKMVGCGKCINMLKHEFTLGNESWHRMLSG